MTMPSLVKQLRAMYPREPIGNWGKLAAEQIEKLSADLDVTKQNYVHSCECRDNWDVMIAERDAEIERLQISVADFKYNAEAAHRVADERGAEIERLRAEVDVLNAIHDTESDDALLRYRRSPLSESHRAAWERAAEKTRLP